MTREILVSREAHLDLAEAAGHLGSISPRLAARFTAELERVFTNVAEYPEMYPLVHKNFRRALLCKFPYSVFYIVAESFILIVGVVHQARDESAWKRRA